MRDKNQQYELATPEASTGRLLLNIKDQFIQRYDTFEYAKKFASDFDDILNSRWTSSRVTTGEVYGDFVDLEFSHHNHDAFVWKIIVHSKKHTLQGSALSLGSHAGEQYEIIAQNDNLKATYYRLNHQNTVMHKIPVYNPEEISTLQGLVEYFTDTKDFYKYTSDIRSDMSRSHRTISQLANKEIRNFSDEKNIQSLKNHLFRAGFPVGSPDISDKKPLY